MAANSFKTHQHFENMLLNCSSYDYGLHICLIQCANGLIEQFRGGPSSLCKLNAHNFEHEVPEMEEVFKKPNAHNLSSRNEGNPSPPCAISLT